MFPNSFLYNLVLYLLKRTFKKLLIDIRTKINENFHQLITIPILNRIHPLRLLSSFPASATGCFSKSVCSLRTTATKNSDIVCLITWIVKEVAYIFSSRSLQLNNKIRWNTQDWKVGALSFSSSRENVLKSPPIPLVCHLEFCSTRVSWNYWNARDYLKKYRRNGAL